MSSGLKPHHAPRFKVDHRPYDPTVETLQVPGFRQTRNYSCGYSSALMLVRYFSCDVSGEDLFSSLETDGEGTSQTAMVRELRHAGLRVTLRYDLDFEKYAYYIAKGKPVVVYLHDAEHWAVLYGVGTVPDRVFIADPRPQHRCEQLWGEYESKLRGFGMICSHADMPQRKALEQPPLLPATSMVTNPPKPREKRDLPVSPLDPREQLLLF